MKVRTKIALLLFLVVATFVAGLTAVKISDRKRFREVAAAREEERQRSFDEFVRHWTEPLATFVKEFTTWDQMGEAIARVNPEWISANLHDHTLNSYKAHVIWAYRPDYTLAFTRNTVSTDAFAEVPLPPGTLPRLFEKERFCHFFTRTPLGWMEIRGATVHPSRDSARATPPQGALFAGRLWTNEDLREMSLFTGNIVRIVTPSEVSDPAGQEGIAVATFARPLPGWNETPIAMLLVRSESPVIAQLTRSSNLLFWSLLIFAVVLFLVLVLALSQWVTRPLKALSKGLKAQDPVRIRPLQDGSDEFSDLARMMGAFFDQRRELLREMSERVQAQQALHESEERLRQSQKMEAVGRLAGGIAHDFNNLLTAIIGYAELIALATHEKEVREEADLIRKAGEQAADLTRQLLAFSRKQVLQPRVLDLNVLLVDIEKLLQRVIGEHITLRVHAEAQKSRICADPTQIEQVVVNLAVNARDAMPRGGVVTMRTGNLEIAPGGDGQRPEGLQALAPGCYVLFSVEDGGIGMDEATRERIFEPFFTTKSYGKGTGLGLATVYGIVQQSGGTISVQSAPGRGSTFTILLPHADAPLHIARPPTTVQRPQRPAETVLVVEDDKIVRDLVCAVLLNQGYDLLCASNGAEGLRLAREHPRRLDLLLTDIIMPQMNGPEVAEALRRDQPQVKVLYVSGYTDDVLNDHAAATAELRFLEKPFTPESLCRKIREVLDEPAPAHAEKVPLAR